MKPLEEVGYWQCVSGTIIVSQDLIVMCSEGRQGGEKPDFNYKSHAIPLGTFQLLCFVFETGFPCVAPAVLTLTL